MFKKLIVSLFALLIPAIVVAADVRSDFDRDVNLSSLKTFRFADSSNDLNAKRMRNAIRDSFGEVGLHETTGQADVVVDYHAMVAHNKKIRTSGYGRPGWRGMQSAWVEDSTDGTGIVDLLHADSGELIWRGTVTGAINLSTADQRTRDGMRKLANAFRKDRERQAKGKK